MDARGVGPGFPGRAGGRAAGWLRGEGAEAAIGQGLRSGGAPQEQQVVHAIGAGLVLAFPAARVVLVLRLLVGGPVGGGRWRRRRGAGAAEPGLGRLVQREEPWRPPVCSRREESGRRRRRGGLRGRRGGGCGGGGRVGARRGGSGAKEAERVAGRAGRRRRRAGQRAAPVAAAASSSSAAASSSSGGGSSALGGLPDLHPERVGRALLLGLDPGHAGIHPSGLAAPCGSCPPTAHAGLSEARGREGGGRGGAKEGRRPSRGHWRMPSGGERGAAPARWDRGSLQTAAAF